ncbi:MAG: choice-of-anchor Q domain-containing protein, partial [Candidatus Desantisbacteria bacterium]
MKRAVLMGMILGMVIGIGTKAEATGSVTVYNASGGFVCATDTIQWGIDACPTGGTVTCADGTYTGASNKNLSWSGKHIAVKSINGHSNCIIDCQNSGRGFYFNSTGQNSTDIIQGFTIRNGYVTGDWPANCGGGIWCYSSSSPAIRYSDFWGNNPQNYSGISDQTGINGNISQNPQFIGGGDYHLQSTSPCIDSGLNSACLVTTDLDGNPRIVRIVDMGPYELQGTPIIESIVVSPSSGPINVGVTVNGNGFCANEVVQIDFGT